MISKIPKWLGCDFGLDCGPWNTNPFAVPWQLNHFHDMLKSNLLTIITMLLCE